MRTSLEEVRAPQTQVVSYRDDDGTVPILDWFDTLPEKALVKCRVKIDGLRELGHELRRPEADYLCDGIYELRVHLRTVNYRMLYLFHEDIAAVVSHGLMKEQRFAPKEIDRALTAKPIYFEDRHGRLPTIYNPVGNDG
jgi:phage-related protein